MTLEDAQKIVAASKKLPDCEVMLRENYSGRGMMGRKTAAVVGTEFDVLEATQSVGVRISTLRWDDMGFQKVAY